MVVSLYTLEAFEAFIAQPENESRLFELIHGEIVEKMPSNPYASAIAIKISFFIVQWMREQGIQGVVTGEAGGYIIDGERYAPDVAFATNTELATTGYNPSPPDLAVEVETNTTAETERRLRLKISHYIHAGTVVWVVYPELKEVEVHIPGEAVQRLRAGDTLPGGATLPGFTLAVQEIFAT